MNVTRLNYYSIFITVLVTIKYLYFILLFISIQYKRYKFKFNSKYFVNDVNFTEKCLNANI